MVDKKTNLDDVKVGDLMALITFVKVGSVSGSNVAVTNLDTGLNFDVRGRELVEQMASADRFLATEEATKTQLAEKLVSSFNTPFTVVFSKQDNTNRTLRGRLISAEPLLGRSKVRDLDISNGDSMRLVDHRSLKSLIVDGTRYVLKG